MPFQISRDGQTYGPYTIEDVRRYVASGNILPTDLARDEAGTDWLPVSHLLSASAPPPAIQPAAFGTAPAWQPEPGSGDRATAPASERYPYFPISTPKFVVMSLVTFGLYHVYWAYKNWDRIRADSGDSSIMAWARALFLGIWNFGLFDRVRDHALHEEIAVPWNHVVLGICVLVMAATSRLPRAWSAISLFSFLPYLPVIATIQRINGRLAGSTAEQPNDRFSGINIAGIVAGGLLLVLAIVGWMSMAAGIVPRRP